MRRAVVGLVLVLSVLVIAPVAAGAQSSDPGTAQGAGQTTELDPGATSIIGSPHAEGGSNIGGLVVGLVLLGGWFAGGAVLIRNGRRRRAAQLAA